MDWYDKITKLIEDTTVCIDCLDEAIKLENQCMDYLDGLDENMVEGVVIKKVMRKGRAIRKKFCKLATQKQLGGRCVSRSAKERIKRKRANIKSSRKKKGKKGTILRKRRKSLKRGKSMGLYGKKRR